MKLFACSILFLLGTFDSITSNDVPYILDGYITWTETGEADFSKSLFDKKVELAYQTNEGDYTTTPFTEYQRKVESAATSVTRSMAIMDFNYSGNQATAYITDHSDEGNFSLVHQLSLRKKRGEWRIYAITIMYGPYSTGSLSEESSVQH